MDIDSFVTDMNNSKFLEVSDNIIRARDEVNGFSGPYLMNVLSLAVSYMQPGEYYLEIGSYKGRTLVGAMIDNEDKRAVSVDNFSKFDGDVARHELCTNIEKFGIDERVRFLEMDSRAFFETEMPEGIVGVYFYDGDHSTQGGYENLCAATPYLSDEAVIILDDFSSHGVWRSVQMFMNEYPEETALIFCMRTNNFPFPEQNWWNGIVVMGWKPSRNLATGV